MNRSDIKALHERLQARQAEHYPKEFPMLDILGGIALVILFFTLAAI